MYRLTDIIDPLNVLGMQRTQPIPAPYNNTWAVMKGLSGSVTFQPTLTGMSYILHWIYGGVEQVVTHSTNAQQHVQTDPDEIAWIYSYDDPFDIKLGANIRFFAPSNAVQSIDMRDDPDLETIDLRNASIIIGLDNNAINVRTIFANTSDIDRYTISTFFLLPSTVADGTIYIKRNEPYTDNMITDAQNKGWNIVLYD